MTFIVWLAISIFFVLSALYAWFLALIASCKKDDGEHSNKTWDPYS
jgi:hypothetical protein